MNRKLFVVNNPISGGRSYNRRVIRELKDFLDAKDVSYAIKTTTAQSNAQQTIIQQMDDSYTELVVVGGDGTINESVNALNEAIPMSIIPAGTGNDFVKNVNLGKKLSDQLETILSGVIKNVDLGECNGRMFANGVGVGFDGQIVADMNGKKVPFLKGHAKYYYHVLQILASYKERSFHYQLDQTAFQKELILLTIGNGTTYGGGFKLMPDAKVDDGLLEVCSIGAIASAKRFLNIGRLSGGTHGVLKAVDFAQAKRVRIEANTLLEAHLDGEAIGKPPYDIRVLEGALKLRVSANH
jgi:YegS/Rv2252/BmrU family lipid kinase